MDQNKPPKKYFIIIVVLFILSIAYGLWIGLLNPEQNKELIQQSSSFFKSFENSSDFIIFLFILGNNVLKAFLAVILGIFFGLVPLDLIHINGILLGSVIAFSVQTNGIGLLLAATLPHGIIELIGTLTASGYGLWLGVKFFRSIFYKEREELRSATRYALRKFVSFVLPLLVLAAIIEAFITPLVINLFYK